MDAPGESASSAPRTHYGKLSLLMLVIGGVIGHAMASASAGADCKLAATHATNATRVAVLSGVLGSLHVAQPDLLAKQIDDWVEYEGGLASSCAIRRARTRAIRCQAVRIARAPSAARLSSNARHPLLLPEALLLG